jgi:hypothetical protein
VDDERWNAELSAPLHLVVHRLPGASPQDVVWRTEVDQVGGVCQRATHQLADALVTPRRDIVVSEAPPHPALLVLDEHLQRRAAQHLGVGDAACHPAGNRDVRAETWRAPLQLGGARSQRTHGT